MSDHLPPAGAALKAVAILAACLVLITGCARPSGIQGRLPAPWSGEIPLPSIESESPPPSATPHPIFSLLPTARPAGMPDVEPTPDAIREPPVLRTSADTYVVQPGDSLNRIAGQFGVSAESILRANRLANADVLPVWMALIIPAPVPQPAGPRNKELPDSELVFGPAAAFFDVQAEITRQGGYLSGYSEEVEERVLSGAEIVELAARRYSVNPRLLLAVLEFQSGWLRASNPDASTRAYPMGFVRLRREGLFSQVSLAADMLNKGYYLWRAGWAGPFVTPDGAAIPPGEGINAGTAGVQYLFSHLYASDAWRRVVGPDGFYATWTSLVGNPFYRGVEPLLPPDLLQPELHLPFENGIAWSFTSGPHSGWDTGAAWAALDFAPPGDALGCVWSNAWITAAADGLVLRADQGELILDLDQDGVEQTGWVLLYMHVESRDRAQPGTRVQAGDRLGHPSCEGGVSNGTHLHLARKYNGEWIAADGSLPFVLDGWVSKGAGREYDGTLERGDVILEACDCRNDGNQVAR
ncbi:MAG: LysM peptidoglycan-binding domain-containing protein [Anaerolineales bacterium]|nr:LysM peptidoglycan-binding domain-containing protein [Anaerolineales bacterium]